MSFAPTKPGSDPELPVPRHIAVIMDGNGRWAKARGLPRSFGHRQGVEAARRAVRAARELGVQYLTLYGFSSENWKRPPEEVGELMGLLRFFVRSDLADLDKNNVRIRIIGERRGLADDIVTLLEDAESRTRHNTGLTLIIAFNYGGQDEIARAARALAYDVACGALDPEAVTPESLAARLDTRDVPNPDLVIRTSGEKRLSNFLIWQCAYAELAFLDVYWPDFSRAHMAEAITEYQSRERRFGAVEPAKRA